MPKTVLIIEDEAPLLSALEEKIQNVGFETLIADNGEAGLKIALDNHPDLILLDIKMPNMNGMEMMKELRKDAWGDKVPVILLTNIPPESEEILQGIVEDHPAFYLMKSQWQIKDVVAKIMKILE